MARISSSSSSTTMSSSSWISLTEAQERSPGRVQWWKLPGPQPNRPVIYIADGDDSRRAYVDAGKLFIYIGEWSTGNATGATRPAMHGWGYLLFSNGRLYVGQFMNGQCHGWGRLLWLPESPVWRSQHHPESSILTPTTTIKTTNIPNDTTKRPIPPYVYQGYFVHGQKWDSEASIVLADGTVRVGPFVRDCPEGNWLQECTPLPHRIDVSHWIHVSDYYDWERHRIASLSSSSSSAMESRACWISLEQSRELCYGQVTWWKCATPHHHCRHNNNNQDDDRSTNPSDESHWDTANLRMKTETMKRCPDPNHPVLLGEDDTLYYGTFDSEWRYHGWGCLYCPNGRVIKAIFRHGQCHGPAVMTWVPQAPTWQAQIQTPHSVVEGMRPYIYVGRFQNNQRWDRSAVVIMDDATARYGPWKKDEPIQWDQHVVTRVSHVTLEALLSFRDEVMLPPSLCLRVTSKPSRHVSPDSVITVIDSNAKSLSSPSLSPPSVPLIGRKVLFNNYNNDGASSTTTTTTTTSLLPQSIVPGHEEYWLTLEEARYRSHGHICWWRLRGPSGQTVQEQQYRHDRPHGCPVFLHPDGWMYLGPWNDQQELDGFGALYFPNGRMYVGCLRRGLCTGLAITAWDEYSPTWIENYHSFSLLGNLQPYIYIGKYKSGLCNDPKARVILKDGTTRVGPFENNAPVGGGWLKHTLQEPTTKTALAELLQTKRASQQIKTEQMMSLNVQTSSIVVTSNAAQTGKQWISLEEARERSIGKVSWWKCTGPDGELVQEIQQNLEGPSQCPVWTTESGWMYLGGWILSFDVWNFHGLGILYFPNGRIFIGQHKYGVIEGRGKLAWVPKAPEWEANKQAFSVISTEDGQTGLPYIYIGNFIKSERVDPHARVILKDGTTRVGPFKDNAPLGNWWEDHDAMFTSPDELSRLMSFGNALLPKNSLAAIHNSEEARRNSGISLQLDTSDHSDDDVSDDQDDDGEDLDDSEEFVYGYETWITFAEARERSFGRVAWWRCKGPNGEQVRERQHHPLGPTNRPVWLDSNGLMYLGGWKENEFHGLGAMYLPEGRVYMGYMKDSMCSGLGILLWVPDAPTWLNNEDHSSLVARRGTTDGVYKTSGPGLPYVYIGHFENGLQSDLRARIILKNGAIRVGPVENNKPMGNWSEELGNSTASPEELANLFSFESDTTGGEGNFIDMQIAKSLIEEAQTELAKISLCYDIDKGLDGYYLSLYMWMVTVFADALHPQDLERYARCFVDRGLHSPTLIEEHTSPTDVRQFNWMEERHRRILSSFLSEKAR